MSSKAAMQLGLPIIIGIAVVGITYMFVKKFCEQAFEDRKSKGIILSSLFGLLIALYFNMRKKSNSSVPQKQNLQSFPQQQSFQSLPQQQSLQSFPQQQQYSQQQYQQFPAYQQQYPQQYYQQFPQYPQQQIQQQQYQQQQMQQLEYQREQQIQQQEYQREQEMRQQQEIQKQQEQQQQQQQQQTDLKWTTYFDPEIQCEKFVNNQTGVVQYKNPYTGDASCFDNWLIKKQTEQQIL
jgi:FtsZ-interacting cell division protein ZipA